ncbi:MAG: hypothetical protein OEN01_04585, partial [Candidatus Krumholzibacteria bacterium]|nr:hypothetical protein [Candidatus Krumholzibacteria bacterium]
SQQSPVSEQLQAAWGTDSRNVFAVGSGGVVLRFDGDRWRDLPGITSHSLSGLRTGSSDEVYVVGTAGTILRYGP